MIKTTRSQKIEILKKIESGKYLNDEKVWTFLLAHLIDKQTKKTKLDILRLFTDQDITAVPDEIWFEAQPISPRRGARKGESEGNTKIDLAFGDIALRDKTECGIKYNSSNDWVCFVEAKLFSDCSPDTAHDPFRNQLSRVIENLVTFQDNGAYPANTYFTLLTPRIFKEKPFSKLYGYKFFEFMDRDNLSRDFEVCAIAERDDSTFQYPDKETLMNRLKSLKLNWITYEEVFKLTLGIEVNIADLGKKIPMELVQSLEAVKSDLKMKNISNKQ